MEFITIGQILKPQGIKGELKIKPLTDNLERFKKLKVIYIENVSYQIDSMRFDPLYVYIFFKGLSDRTTAETFAGKFVAIDKINAVPLPKNTYFISDIIGCNIMYESGELIGKITAVDCFGSADVITVKCKSGKVLRFPFLNKVVSRVDIENLQFVVKEKLLGEVSVYED